MDGLVANLITLFDIQSQGRPLSMSCEDYFYEDGVTLTRVSMLPYGTENLAIGNVPYTNGPILGAADCPTF